MTTTAARAATADAAVRPDLLGAFRHGVLSTLGSLARTAALVYAVVLFIWAATGRSTGGADATAASRAAFTTWLAMYGAQPSFGGLTIAIPALGLVAVGMWSTYRAARRGINDLTTMHPGAIVVFVLSAIATQAGVIAAAAAWVNSLMGSVSPLQACGAAAMCAALMMWLLMGNQDVADALYVQWRRPTALAFSVVRRFAYAYLLVSAFAYIALWVVNLSAVRAVTEPVVSDVLSQVAMAIVNLLFAPTALAWVGLGMSGGLVAAGSAELGLFSGTTVTWPQLASFAVLPTNMHPYAMALLLVPIAVAAYAAYACIDQSDRRGWWPIVRVSFTVALCAGAAAFGLAFTTGGGILGASGGAWDHLGADLMCAGYLSAEVFVGAALGLWLAGREHSRDITPDESRTSFVGRLQTLIKRGSANQ